MNTYLIPIYDDGNAFIMKVDANSYDEVNEELIKMFNSEFGTNLTDFDSLIDWSVSHNVCIGDTYNIEEFK